MCSADACVLVDAQTTACVPAGQVHGSFGVQVNVPGSGVASVSGETAAGVALQFNLDVTATVATSTQGDRTLVIDLLSGFAGPRGVREFELQLPLAHVARGIPLAFGWDIAGAVIVQTASVTVEEIAVDGALVLTRTGSVDGAQIVGALMTRLTPP
jgi:hypothetical protein